MGYTMDEVTKHNSKSSCWVVVDGSVLDVTEFLKDHPGGELAILTFAGKDATEEFNMIHPPDVIGKYLPKDKVLGPVGGAGAAAVQIAEPLASAAAPAGDLAMKGDLLANMQSWGEWRDGLDDNPGIFIINIWSYLAAAWVMVVAVVMEVVRTIFTVKNFKISNDRAGLTRSAMFLIVFQIIHAVGNLHVFLGPDDFNGYGYFYVRLYWTGFGLPANIVEEYVLLAAVLHVFVGLKRTWDNTLNIAGGNMNLALTGITLLTFMTIHLFQFRFGDTEPYLVRPPPYMINFFGIPKLQLFWENDLSVPQVPVRDIYKLEFDLFKSMGWVVFYMCCVVVFMVHACLGWQKMVPAPALMIPKGHVNRVKAIGYAIIVAVGFIYLSFPMYTHFTPMKTGFGGMVG